MPARIAKKSIMPASILCYSTQSADLDLPSVANTPKLDGIFTDVGFDYARGDFLPMPFPRSVFSLIRGRWKIIGSTAREMPLIMIRCDVDRYNNNNNNKER